MGIGNHGGTFHLFPFDGLIDEVAVYARALRAEEIAQRALVEEFPPTVTIAPLQQAVPMHGTAQFTATASGSPPLAFQWHFDGQPIPGATGSALVLSNVQPAQAGQYLVTVSNAWGAASSSNAVLTVLPMAPAFSLHPTNLMVRVGATATLPARALAIPSPVYQWFFNGSPLPGRTTTALVLSDVEPAHAGTYWVVASNLFGVATSSNATLTVLPPPTCVPVPAGAVAWWRGESNSLDSIGGFDALPIPYLQAFTVGKVGTALLFTGRNDYTVPAAPALDVGAGDGFTIEGWIAPRMAPAYLPLVGWNDFGRPGVALGLNWVWEFNAYAPVLEAQFWVTNPPSPRLITFRSPPRAITIATQAWSHVALAYDKSSGLAALYFNGVVVAETNLGSFRLQTQYPLDLGVSVGIIWRVDEISWRDGRGYTLQPRADRGRDPEHCGCRQRGQMLRCHTAPLPRHQCGVGGVVARRIQHTGQRGLQPRGDGSWHTAPGAGVFQRTFWRVFCPAQRKLRRYAGQHES